PRPAHRRAAQRSTAYNTVDVARGRRRPAGRRVGRRQSESGLACEPHRPSRSCGRRIAGQGSGARRGRSVDRGRSGSGVAAHHRRTTPHREISEQIGARIPGDPAYSPIVVPAVSTDLGSSRMTVKKSDTTGRHVAAGHDGISVHGARVNNLRDVSVEIPKRRLTVCTGVSGSGKSSLVFGTIAAESQRLINETYSAFVQGFMPTLARPDVDVLDGITAAIIVGQERMGSNPRSTVGTATDA